MFTENDCYTRLRTWKVRADRRKVVMDEVAHDVSWASEKGTKRLVRLPMSLMRVWAWAPREPKVETTKVTTPTYVVKKYLYLL